MEHDYLVSKALFRSAARVAKPGLVARKTAAVTGANADEVSRAVDRSVRRAAIAGGTAAASAATVPLVVHHSMARHRERKRFGKADMTFKQRQGQQMNAGLLGLVQPVNGIYAATQAREGRKAAVAGRTIGRGLLETGIGGVAGSLAGGLVSRGRLMTLGSTVGSVGGAIHGSKHAMRSAQDRGDIKGVPKSRKKK